MQNDCTKHTEYNVKLMKSWMNGDKALALMTTTIKRFLLLASGSANALMLFAISHNFFASNLFLFRNNYRLLRGKKNVNISSTVCSVYMYILCHYCDFMAYSMDIFLKC